MLFNPADVKDALNITSKNSWGSWFISCTNPLSFFFFLFFFFFRSSLIIFFLVPRASPYVYYKVLGAHSINISINPIPKQYHNGKLLGYTIRYQDLCQGNFSLRVNVGVANRSYILTGLKPGKQYKILVAGFTSAGTGPYRNIYLYTGKWMSRSVVYEYGVLTIF